MRKPAPTKYRSFSPGGIVGYPSDLFYEEVAFIAFHFHWSLEDILNLTHSDRRRWVEEISKLIA
ncbi:DUF6760 family protein [Tumidithrix elongata]|uniref:DUF6760 family protein n=1 Tax=Tumidithrix elongata TaxID=3088357 RepID=UPI0038CDB48A